MRTDHASVHFIFADAVDASSVDDASVNKLIQVQYMVVGRYRTRSRKLFGQYTNLVKSPLASVGVKHSG